MKWLTQWGRCSFGPVSTKTSIFSMLGFSFFRVKGEVKKASGANKPSTGMGLVQAQYALCPFNDRSIHHFPVV